MPNTLPVQPTRRSLLIMGAAAIVLTALPPVVRRAAAQGAQDAPTRFIRQTAEQLVDVVNGPGSHAEKRAKLQQVIDGSVDVDAIARFCLGRFWNSASSEQRMQYVRLFHEVLLNNITGHLGEYRGVSFDIGRSTPREDTEIVSTTVHRPNNPDANVDWVISTASGNPRIIDVIAEGTSLRLTQRQDYMSYLVHNGNSVDKLIEAMRQQANQNG